MKNFSSLYIYISAFIHLLMDTDGFHWGTMDNEHGDKYISLRY